jgi:phosphatidylserine/phosphatidylglycerophosphate/cardiolipin synthase-like enzyme
MGSQNWSDAANYVNDETLIVVEAVGISGQYAQEYERIKQKSRLGVPAALKKEITRLETGCAGRGFYF